MKFKAVCGDIRDLPTDCTVLITDTRLTKNLQGLFPQNVQDVIEKSVKNANFRSKWKHSLTIPLPFPTHKSCLIASAGNMDKCTPTRFHQFAHMVAGKIKTLRVQRIIVVCKLSPIDTSYTSEWMIKKLATSLGHAYYHYSKTLSASKSNPSALKEVSFFVADKDAKKKAEEALIQAQAINAGSQVMRNLANLPGNICTPKYMGTTALRLARKMRDVECKVLTESEAKKIGMGAFVAVSQGSKESGRVVCLEYKGGKSGAPPIALVGKGITFDTGGISIKPSSAMDEMKFDMSGAASVLGAFVACAQLGLKINLVGILACAENMPGGVAIKPGDVVKTLSGKTVEILNTDAEGRLVLCDALTYVQRFKPKCIIDIATLTGACVVALGNEASGLMSNNQDLADKLLRAGTLSCDRCWQLPMWEEYAPQLKSNFADLANIGGRYAGTITAALFLSKFTQKYPWAHLDIAGVAWTSGSNKGSTARPVELLLEFLRSEDKAAD